jgi:hypothetical protein
MSGFAYRTTGGYFIGSEPTHDLLVEAPASAYEMAAVRVVRGGSPPSDNAADAARQQLRDLGVTAIVVVPEGGDVAAVLNWTRRVSGAPGQQFDEAWLFRLSPR